jgi:pimeloyl-ACP methyl ester carboxylesterase
MGQVHPDSASAKLPHALQVLAVRAFLHTPPGRGMLDHLPTVGPEVRRILDNEAPASEYASIDAEVLLAYGSRSSKYFGDTCHALAGALPHARVVEIPRASHNTANIAPQRLTAPLIDFFTRGR